MSIELLGITEMKGNALISVGHDWIWNSSMLGNQMMCDLVSLPYLSPLRLKCDLWFVQYIAYVQIFSSIDCYLSCHWSQEISLFDSENYDHFHNVLLIIQAIFRFDDDFKNQDANSISHYFILNQRHCTGHCAEYTY